jgi:glycine dehydrogenase subunit 1
MRYTQLTPDHVRHMLDTIGAASIEELLAPIPADHRCGGPLSIPAGASEPDILRDTSVLAQRNQDTTKLVSFLGAGAYDHFIPTLVDHLAMQGEFLTAYTPYQAEASQGILQVFYEFQTMVCQLTGMEVANASLYEGASAAAEAMMMATAITQRNRLLVAESVHPHTLGVLRAYAGQRDVEVETAPTEHGVLDRWTLANLQDERTAAVLLQYPNFYGNLERLDEIIAIIHEAGALAIVSMDPISSGLLKPPGAFDADIVVGEGQALGIPLQYGGPYLGLMAAREKHLRKMPGRIVGMTHDREGRRGFCLTLQTREQHIRRERATSNVCTNQGLMATRAAVYLATMGRAGMGRIASRCFDKAHYAARCITGLPGYTLRFEAPFFKEFTVRTKHDVRRVLDACRQRGILAGVPLGRLDERYADCFLVAVTEKRTKTEIDELVAALGSV